jgi:hypothetical protein
MRVEVLTHAAGEQEPNNRGDCAALSLLVLVLLKRVQCLVSAVGCVWVSQCVGTTRVKDGMVTRTRARAHTHTHTHTHMHTHTHSLTHTRAHTHILAHTHTHTYSNTHPHPHPPTHPPTHTHTHTHRMKMTTRKTRSQWWMCRRV